MSLSAAGKEDCECGIGFVLGEEGLTSERMDIGEIELSISAGLCWLICLGDLGANAVARDIRRTIRGRTCLPSDFV